MGLCRFYDGSIGLCVEGPILAVDREERTAEGVRHFGIVTRPVEKRAFLARLSNNALIATTARSRRARLVADALLVLSLAAIYFIVGKLGLKLAYLHPSATAVWPPTGVTLVVFLMLGYRVWPGIFLGALLVNLTTAGSLPVCLGIAAGNTFEGLVGCYLLNKFAGGEDAFESAKGVLAFVIY